MTIPNRDIQILQKIQGYCDDIMFTHTQQSDLSERDCALPFADWGVGEETF